MSHKRDNQRAITVRIGGLAADLYLPGRPVRTGVVFLHGGGFVGGSRTQFAKICRRLSADGPTACLSLDYRLAPEYNFPAPVQDAVEAFRWLMQATGLAAERIVLAGGSPGGCIAALAVLSGAEQHAAWNILPGASPKRAILLNGICDLPGFYRQNPGEQARVRAFLGGDLQKLQEADPGRYRPEGRSLLLLHGTADEVVLPEQCRAFAHGLELAGSHAQTVWFYGKAHAWFNTPGQDVPVAHCIGRYLQRISKE
ncbi:MAG: alpha/beta hydrolase [Oscillospiraceae bacterium]|nr:alpha/beta hydrolase [Oscillospiraceae bacterium]